MGKIKATNSGNSVTVCLYKKQYTSFYLIKSAHRRRITVTKIKHHNSGPEGNYHSWYSKGAQASLKSEKKVENQKLGNKKNASTNTADYAYQSEFNKKSNDFADISVLKNVTNFYNNSLSKINYFKFISRCWALYYNYAFLTEHSKNANLRLVKFLYNNYQVSTENDTK